MSDSLDVISTLHLGDQAIFVGALMQSICQGALDVLLVAPPLGNEWMDTIVPLFSAELRVDQCAVVISGTIFVTGVMAIVRVLPLGTAASGTSHAIS